MVVELMSAFSATNRHTNIASIISGGYIITSKRLLLETREQPVNDASPETLPSCSRDDTHCSCIIPS